MIPQSWCSASVPAPGADGAQTKSGSKPQLWLCQCSLQDTVRQSTAWHFGHVAHLPALHQWFSCPVPTEELLKWVLLGSPLGHGLAWAARRGIPSWSHLPALHSPSLYLGLCPSTSALPSIYRWCILFPFDYLLLHISHIFCSSTFPSPEQLSISGRFYHVTIIPYFPDNGF